MTMNFAAIVTPLNKNLHEIASFLDGEVSGNHILCREKRILPESFGADVLYVPQPRKPFKLLVCDMESTIIENEFLDEIGDYLGIGKQVEEITRRAMNGELDFESALKERIKLCAALTKQEAENILKTRLKYNKGAAELVKGCKAAGIHTMLVSGGFTMFTEAVKNTLGFDEHHANELFFDGGKISGVREPILGKEAKLIFTKNKCAELGIELSQVITVGDGANDLPMLHAAGLGVAYYAKPKVKTEIANQINFGDLATILTAL